MITLAPKTPHARLRNENNTQFGSTKAFPKTPLPSSKQILDSTQSGKPIAGPTNQLRKALGDKTPGTHLQNRGLKLVVQNPGGKSTVLIEEKPPSASRKSVKRPRVSAGFKTPNPATQKLHWDVVDADVEEQITLKEEKEDDDEPEYMPPRVSIPPVETEYNLHSGAELGKMLNDMAHTPYHWHDDTPISFDEEAFLISEDLLIIPLGALPDESLPFLSDSESESDKSTDPITVDKKPAVAPKKAPVPFHNTRGQVSRRLAPPIATARTTTTATTAGASSSKRAPISTPAIPARRKSATTSALRIPLRTTAAAAAGPPTRFTRSSNTVTLARSRIPTGATKGKGRALPSPPPRQPESNDALRHLPPALRELLEKNEPVFDDFQFDV